MTDAVQHHAPSMVAATAGVVHRHSRCWVLAFVIVEMPAVQPQLLTAHFSISSMPEMLQASPSRERRSTDDSSSRWTTEFQRREAEMTFPQPRAGLRRPHPDSRAAQTACRD